MLKKIMGQMSEAFPNYHLSEMDWGIHWQRSTSSDFIFTKYIDKTILKYIEEIDGEKKVFVVDDSGRDLQLWSRQYQKIDFPFIDDFIFESFSFNDRRRVAAEHYSFLEFLPEFCDIPEEDIKSFDQLARGLLHLGQNARMWMIQAHSTTPISMTLTTEMEGMGNDTFICFLGTQSSFRQRGLAHSLVKFILSHVKKNSTSYILSYNGLPSENFCRSLGFNLDLGFKVYV